MAGQQPRSENASAPSLSLTGFRLVIADHALGLPVFRALSLCTCRRYYPGAASERIASLMSSRRISLPRKGCRVDPRIVLFEDCSAFTRVAACTLPLPPIRDTLIEGFSHFVTSMTAPIASGWSGCRVGLAPTGKRRLVTAHTQSGRRPRNRPAGASLLISTSQAVTKSEFSRLAIRAEGCCALASSVVALSGGVGWEICSKGRSPMARQQIERLDLVDRSRIAYLRMDQETGSCSGAGVYFKFCESCHHMAAAVTRTVADAIRPPDRFFGSYATAASFTLADLTFAWVGVMAGIAGLATLLLGYAASFRLERN